MKKTKSLNLLMISLLTPAIALCSYRQPQESNEITFSFYGDDRQEKIFGQPAEQSKEELAFYRDNQPADNQMHRAPLFKKHYDGAQQFVQKKEDAKYTDARAANKVGYKKQIKKNPLSNATRLVVGSAAYAAVKNMK